MIKSDGFYDYAWNPVEGCLNNCPYCYAKKDIERAGKSFVPTFYEERLLEPSKVKPCTIFATHYTDLMGDFIPGKWIDAVINECRSLPKHTFIFITKNPIRYYDFKWPENCILGVTIESSDKWHRAKTMEDLPYRKMASVEPIKGGFEDYDFSQFELVVVGALFGAVMKTKGKWVNSIKHPNIHYKANVRQYLL